MLRKAILSALVIASSILGSPIENDLYNVQVQENKFLNSKRTANVNNNQISYRLPTDSFPLHYDIELTTNIHEQNFDFTGEVRIHIKIVKPTEVITIHNRQTVIKQIDILTAQSSYVVQNTTFNRLDSHDFLIIDLDRNYTAEQELILRIQYSGKLRDDGQGFYWGSYMNNNGEKKYYGATQFEVDDARHAVPCYDEPGIRATMTLTITHGKSYTAIANTEVDEQTELPNSYVTKFKPTLKMQSYLLAFAISDFDHINATDTRIPQKIYATPIAIANGEAEYAARTVGSVLAKFEEVLNVPYPLTKMDHIALTFFNFGAMENFGLITYIDYGLLLDPRTSESAKNNKEMSILGLIAHEYAHQWFGNIISPVWWEYTWLNEGFATLFANYIPHLLYPEKNVMRQFFTSVMPTAFRNDMIGSWSMNHYTEQPDELWSKFGGIGYQKSGCVIRMFMEVFTPEVFLKGLTKYIRNNYMMAATPAKLHVSLQEAYDEAFPGESLNVDQLMGSWENTPGYPLISVNISGSNLVFTQSRYPANAGELYSVPITLATKSTPDFTIRTPKFWLYNSTTIKSQSAVGFNTNDWIVLNIDQVGYYRVNYDLTLWRTLIAQLIDNHNLISPINRAVLQSELFMALTELGHVSGTDALNILSYFDKESEAIAWGRGDSILDHLYKHLYGTSIFDKYLEMVKNLSRPHLDDLGHEGFDGEDSDRASLRRYAKKWNCEALDGDCLINEYQKLQAYLQGTSTTSFNWCYGLRLVEEGLFNQEFDKIIAEIDAVNRRNFILFSGCSLSPKNQNRILEAVLNGTNNLSEIDRKDLLASLYKNSIDGLDRVLNYIDVSFLALSK